MEPGEHRPRVHDHAAHGHGPDEPCTWHEEGTGKLQSPARAKGRLDRKRGSHARR
jgi:hypothetical protein